MKRIRESFLANPFEYAVCVWAVLILANAIDIFWNWDSFPEASKVGLLSLPMFILWGWVVVGILGNTLVIIGLTMSSFSKGGRMIEEMGLWLAGAMWLSVFVPAFVFNPDRFTMYGQYGALAVGCFMRIVMLNRVETLYRKHGVIT